MFTHPDRIGQLATEHHGHMLAEATQRTLRHQHGRRSSASTDTAARITRRLATAIARAAAAVETAAIWPARTRPAGQPPKPTGQATVTDPGTGQPPHAIDAEPVRQAGGNPGPRRQHALLNPGRPDQGGATG